MVSEKVREGIDELIDAAYAGPQEGIDAARAALIAAIESEIADEREACAVIAEQTAAAKPVHSTRPARKPPATPCLSRIVIAEAIRARSKP